MTDGETGDRAIWCSRTIEWLRINPDTELVHDGVYTDYGAGPLYRVPDGGSLDPKNLHLNYFDAFAESFPAFKYLRDRAGHTGIRFQVGLPSPLDITMLAFGMDVAMSDRDIPQAWAEATVDQVHRITEAADEPIVFQIEPPAGLIAVGRGGRGNQANDSGTSGAGPARPGGPHAQGHTFRSPPVPGRSSAPGVAGHVRRAAPGAAGQCRRRRLP
ncbi:hypothetical protein [Streptomyces sp. NPDC001404]|uniref:hypothetical protein n=1 Tax=Streptomyces sp. NPDC001404 TaxID=3364571 RepID=UPI0036C81DCE